MPLRELLMIGLAFNVYWLVAVIGQGQYAELLICTLLVSWWLYRDAWRFASVLASVGILMDWLLSYFGIYQFGQVIFPIWLALLWLGFGTFVWAMRPFIASYSPPLMIVVGGIGGTVSYLAGYRLGAVMFPGHIVISAITIFISWLVFSAFILALLHRFEVAQRKYNPEEV